MKLELIIPIKLSEIPLMNYQKFIDVATKSNDEVFIAEKMIQFFCGIELKDVVKIPYKEIENLTVHFNNLFQQKQELKHRFKIQDIEFGFITNLEDISWGEYIDIESNLNDWSNFHKALAVLYRPIVKSDSKGKYLIQEYDGKLEYADLMKYCPLDIAMSASVFFYHLESELLKATMYYLENQVMKNKEIKTILAKELNLGSSGDGIQAYMQQLKETSQNLTKLQALDLSKYLPSLLSKSKNKKLNKESLTVN